MADDVDIAAVAQRSHDLIFQLLVLLRVVETEQKLDCFISAAPRDSTDRSFAKLDIV